MIICPNDITSRVPSAKNDPSRPLCTCLCGTTTAEVVVFQRISQKSGIPYLFTWTLRHNVEPPKYWTVGEIPKEDKYIFLRFGIWSSKHMPSNWVSTVERWTVGAVKLLEIWFGTHFQGEKESVEITSRERERKSKLSLKFRCLL